jgi:radial spoke head protein 1
MNYKDGSDYYGFWENGRRHGEGVFTYKNGDMYSGWWKFGEKEGTGTYTFKSTGMKLFGEWTNGEITQGKWIYPNGMYYEGGFSNNKPKGDGKWVFKNGNVLSGMYEQKELPPPEDGEGEGEGGDVVKAKYSLEWNSHTNITESAHKVNSVEQ